MVVHQRVSDYSIKDVVMYIADGEKEIGIIESIMYSVITGKHKPEDQFEYYINGFWRDEKYIIKQFIEK